MSRFGLILFSLLFLKSCSARDEPVQCRRRHTQRREGPGDAVPVSTAAVVQKAMPVAVAAVGTAEAMEAVGDRLRSRALLPDAREVHDYFDRFLHVLRRDPL
jgi:hypothetical protein